MNSLQNQPQIGGETPEEYVATFERQLAEMTLVPEVETLMRKLQFLGLNYDPFGQEPSSESLQVIENLNLTLHLQNPYQVTNLLLRLLDKTEERLNNLKQ
jgi:hypothetical protein